MRYLFTLQNFSTVSYVNNAKEYYAKSNGVKCFFSETEDGPVIYTRTVEDIVDYDTLSSFISDAEVNYMAKALFFYNSAMEMPCAWNFYCRQDLKNTLLAAEQEEELLHIVNSGRFSVIRIPLLTRDAKTLQKMAIQKDSLTYNPVSVSTPRGHFHWTHFSQTPAYVTEIPAASLVVVGKDYRDSIKHDLLTFTGKSSTNGVNINASLIVCRTNEAKQKWQTLFQDKIGTLDILSRDTLTKDIYVATYTEIKDLQKQSIDKVKHLKEVIKSEISVDMSNESLFFYLQDWTERFPGFVLPFSTLVWKCIVCDDSVPFLKTFPLVEWNSLAVFYLYVLKNGEHNIPSCDISILYPYFFKTKISKPMMYFFMHATCIFWKHKTLRPGVSFENFFYSDSQGTKIEGMILELYQFKDTLDIPKDILYRSLPAIFKSKQLAISNADLIETTSSFFPHTIAETVSYQFKSEPSADFFKQSLKSEKTCCVCYSNEALHISMCGHILCLPCLGMTQIYKVTPCPSCRSHLTWLDWFSCSEQGDTIFYASPRITAVRRLMCRRGKKKVIVLCKNTVVLENMQDWLKVYKVPFVRTEEITKDTVQVMTFNDFESMGINDSEEYHALMVIIPTLYREQFSRFKYIQQVMESWALPKSTMHVLGLKDGKYIPCT
jgi:hypothetical protein